MQQWKYVYWLLITSQNSFSWLVFIINTERILCEVRTEVLYSIYMKVSLQSVQSILQEEKVKVKLTLHV